MTRILHLTDLHFGAESPPAIDALLGAANELEPDLVVVSGDFTQRGSLPEFEAAAAFLDRIAPPVLAVPGNHDIPQRHLVQRFTRPLHRYRRFIEPRTVDRFADDRIALRGVNSARPFGLHWNWAHGRVARAAIAGAGHWLTERADRPFRALVIHHPPVLFEPRRGFRALGRSGPLLSMLAAVGAQAVLSGHLHATGWRVIDGVLHLQAGTTTSHRVRGEANAMLVLDLHDDHLHVTQWLIAESGRFAAHTSESFPLAPKRQTTPDARR